MKRLYTERTLHMKTLSESELIKLFISSLGSLGAKQYLSSTVERVWGLYEESPRRIYHAKPHIVYVVSWIVHHIKSNPTEGIFLPRLIASMLGHDSIYNIGSVTNEKDSASLAHLDLTHMGVRLHHVTCIERDIMDTCHQCEPDSMEGKCMADADLSSLTRAPDLLWVDTHKLWQESGKDADSFARGNSGFLKSLLGRPRIYYSPYMTKDDECNARTSITEIVRRLDAGLLGKA
jgi:predicted metal-dependent HD superfamily phosphohydrolase